MEIKRIIMCGSRTWENGHAIANELKRLRDKHGDSLVIMHGDEPNGADEQVRYWCEEMQIRHIIYCAAKPKHASHRLCKVVQVSDWNIDGKYAGPKRNMVMRDNEPIGCVAFRSEGKSNGTDGMIRLCADVGIPRIVYMADGTRHIGK